MRNAALVLGIIGGLWGMAVGFVGYGWTELLARYGELAQIRSVEDPGLVRTVGFLAPILAIAGGAMARSANIAGGILMLASAAGMYHAFGFGVFTMFPIGMCLAAGILALAARRPDPH